MWCLPLFSLCLELTWLCRLSFGSIWSLRWFSSFVKKVIGSLLWEKDMKDFFNENYKPLLQEMRGHKQMEKHSMLMVTKNQYCENGHTAQSNLDSMLYPSSYNWPSSQNCKNHLKLHMEPKKSPHSQDNPKQKEQSWKHHTIWLQTILQSYSNQNSMVLVPKQRNKPMEQNRGLGSNNTNLQPSDLLQSWQKQAMGKGFPV